MMRYALIENATVINLAAIHERNAGEFPNAVQCGGVPVEIGDTYADGAFSRNGEPVLSALEIANRIIAALDAEIVELTYQNILLELEV